MSMTNNVVKWLPVVFVESIFAWVYYTYVFRYSYNVIYVGAVGGGVCLMILFHLLIGVTQVSFWRTVLTDPGCIPRGFPRQSNEVDEENALQDNILASETNSKGEQRSCHKCSQLGIVKPDRAHHCSQCRRCVLKMDHHCPFVANCVGFYNYKYFLLFLTYTALTAVYVAITTAPGIFPLITHHAAANSNSDRGTNGVVVGLAVGGSEEDVPVLISFIMGAVFGAGIGLFAGTHYVYVFTNQTTIEALEKRRRGYTNVYNVGFAKNWRQVFGERPAFWMLPIGHGVGDGLYFEKRPNDMEGSGLLVAAQTDLDPQ